MKYICSCILAFCMLASVGLFGCKSEPVKKQMNSIGEFYANGNRLETTVRELTIDGNKASVRFRVVNRGEEEIGSFDINVYFLDAFGNVLYTDYISTVFESPLEVGDGQSLTAGCSGERVNEIERISIASAE